MIGQADEPSGAPPPPPGWYADPSMAGTQRYWDGSSWTAHMAPWSSPAATAKAEDDGSTLALVGLILAFLFPLGGLIAGAALLAKNAIAGGLVIFLSITMATAYAFLIFAL